MQSFNSASAFSVVVAHVKVTAVAQFKQYNFLLDISGHNIYYLSFYRSLQLLGDCCFEEKKRTGKTFKYFVMQHGCHRYPNRSYNYAAFCHFRCVDIKPGSI